MNGIFALNQGLPLPSTTCPVADEKVEHGRFSRGWVRKRSVLSTARQRKDNGGAERPPAAFFARLNLGFSVDISVRSGTSLAAWANVGNQWASPGPQSGPTRPAHQQFKSRLHAVTTASHALVFQRVGLGFPTSFDEHFVRGRGGCSRPRGLCPSWHVCGDCGVVHAEPAMDKLARGLGPCRACLTYLAWFSAPSLRMRSHLVRPPAPLMRPPK
jgi:hypothetical protein